MVKVLVRVLPPLRTDLASDQVDVQGSSVGDVISAIITRSPGLEKSLRDENGSLREFINVFVNSYNIRYIQGELTELHDGDKLVIAPAIAGG